jgi:hypothetical protein
MAGLEAKISAIDISGTTPGAAISAAPSNLTR